MTSVFVYLLELVKYYILHLFTILVEQNYKELKLSFAGVLNGFITFLCYISTTIKNRVIWKFRLYMEK